MRELLNSDSRLSVYMVTDEIGIDKMTAYSITNENLAMQMICASFDLAPAHYFLFSKVKFSFKGYHYGILSSVKETFTRTFRGVLKSAY